MGLRLTSSGPHWDAQQPPTHQNTGLQLLWKQRTPHHQGSEMGSTAVQKSMPKCSVA